MKVRVDGLGTCVLGPDEFVAAGGEGKVYAVGDVAIKVFDDPKLAPPPEKLQVLASISDPRVLAPRGVVTTSRGRFVGYSMPYVESSAVLARVCTPGFQRRQRLSKKRLAEIAESMRTVVEHVHAAGVVIVDLSDNNVLLGVDRCTPYFIDVDSWQTAGHPATAVTLSIRDPSAQGFDVGSDWFSFGIVVFTLLVGIHPFKGKHRTVKALPDRMRDGISVFDPDVAVPPSCRDLQVLPDAFADWCRGLFTHQHRDPPPSLQPQRRGTRRKARAPQGPPPTAAAQATYDSAIVDVVRLDNQLAVRTERSVFVDGQRVGDNPEHAVGLFVGPALGDASPPLLIVHHDPANRRMWFTPAQSSDARMPIAVAADDICVRPDAMFARSGGSIMEVSLTRIGPRLVPTARLRARVLPRSSNLFDGIACQSIEGATMLSLLLPGRTPQLRVPQLDGARIVDAALGGDTVVLLTTREGRCGQFDQWTLHVQSDARSCLAGCRPDVEPREIAWSTDLSGDVVWSTPAAARGASRPDWPHVGARQGDFRPVGLPTGIGWVRDRMLFQGGPAAAGADRGSTGPQRPRRK